MAAANRPLTIQQGDTYTHLVTFSYPTWDADLDYTAGTTVAYLGDTYTAAVDSPAGTLPTDTDHWTVTANDTTRIDVSGTTFTAQIRRSANGKLLADFVVDASAAATGQLVLSLTSEDTTELEGSAVWDLQGITSGVVVTYLSGDVTVTPEVTVP